MGIEVGLKCLPFLGLLGLTSSLEPKRKSNRDWGDRRVLFPLLEKAMG